MTHTEMNDTELKALLEQHFPELAGTPTGATVFASFQQLADHTKQCLSAAQNTKAQRCFDVVNHLYHTCSSRARMAIENVFMFSVGCFMDAMQDRQQANALLPDALQRLAASQRGARDI